VLADVPVLVVPHADPGLALQPPLGADHVAVGAIGHVVALLLEPVDQGELEGQELAGAKGEGVVDDARELRLAAVGAVEADVRPRPLRALRVGVDRVMTGPAVVGLPGVVGALDEHVRGAVVRDHEHDIALPVGRALRVLGPGGEPAQVDAARPVGRDGQARGGLPSALVEVLRAGLRHGLGLALEGAQALHEPGARPAVVPHAEDLDLEPPRRVGRDHQVDHLARLHALARAVPLDPGGAVLLRIRAHPRQLPVARAGLLVLGDDGVLRPRGPGSRWPCPMHGESERQDTQVP
jgi:hypothetical protein